jgi:hypothetical protein
MIEKYYIEMINQGKDQNILNKMKILYSLIVIVFILSGCDDHRNKMKNTLIQIPIIDHYQFAIIDEDTDPILIVIGNIKLEKSLKEIYKKTNSDYAHLECDEINKIKPKGFLTVKKERYENNRFLIDFTVDFCLKNDANSEHCISDLQQFKTEISSNPSCQIIFGGLTRPRMAVSNKFFLDKEKILNAKKFKP